MDPNEAPEALKLMPGPTTAYIPYPTWGCWLADVVHGSWRAPRERASYDPTFVIVNQCIVPEKSGPHYSEGTVCRRFLKIAGQARAKKAITVQTVNPPLPPTLPAIPFSSGRGKMVFGRHRAKLRSAAKNAKRFSAPTSFYIKRSRIRT